MNCDRARDGSVLAGQGFTLYQQVLEEKMLVHPLTVLLFTLKLWNQKQNSSFGVKSEMCLLHNCPLTLKIGFHFHFPLKKQKRMLMNTKVTDDVLPSNNHRQLAQTQPSFLSPLKSKIPYGRLKKWKYSYNDIIYKKFRNTEVQLSLFYSLNLQYLIIYLYHFSLSRIHLKWSTKT